jgi:hypothetical protein
MPLHLGWHLAVWVLLIGTTQEQSLKPPDPDLYQGASTPIGSYREALAHASSHLQIVT